MLQVGHMAASTLNCTYNSAWCIAEDIKKNSSHVRDVNIFGSIARDLIGNDIDLVIIVDEIVFRKFVTTLQDGYINPGDRRFEVAEILQFGEHYFRAFTDNAALDVWLFPTDWKSRNAEIQALLPEHYENFLFNVQQNFRQPLA